MANYLIWPQVLIAIAANGGSFLYGISLGWSAPTGPQILHPSYHFKMTSSEFAWSVSMMSLGGALSCVLSGIIRNRFGTKATIVSFAAPNLIGWLLLIFAFNPWMIIIGRLFIGIAGGAYCFNVPVFIGEISSKEIRGILLTLFQLFVKVGVEFVYVVGSLTDLFMLNVICCAIVLLYTFIFAFLPESPAVLIRKDKIDKAESSIRILRGRKFDAKAEIVEFQQHQARDQVQTKKVTFLEEFQNRATRKAFIIIVLLFFFFQASGINSVMFYATQMFIEAGIQMDPSLATAILGVVQVLGTLATMFVVDRFGRKFLLILSLSTMIVGLIGIGYFFVVKASSPLEAQQLQWLPLPSLCCFVIGFAVGMGSVPFVLLGELFSPTAKRVIAPFAQTMNFVMSFFIGWSYPLIAEALGTGETFFMFAAFSFVGLLFTIFYIPETKGRSLNEIQQLLMK